MAKVDDGGPAFPNHKGSHEQIGNIVSGKWESSATGLSVRDYFAAMALQALATSNRDDDAIATVCYQLADAMLAARKR